MAQAWRTYPGSGRGDPERASRSGVYDRAYLCSGRSAGRQIKGPIQRPGASAPRDGSSHEQSQKHAACRSGNNSLEIINEAATARTPRVAVSYYLLASEQASKRSS